MRLKPTKKKKKNEKIAGKVTVILFGQDAKSGTQFPVFCVFSCIRMQKKVMYK